MRKLIARVDRANPEFSRIRTKEPKTCFEWIRRVEHALRDLVVGDTRMRHGAKWPLEIEKLLGTAAARARETMSRQGVTDPEEIIHFTQLPEIVEVISSNFSLYAPRLGMAKKQFNTFMAPILKGRTEEAHNRPERLWPDLEQQRVKVACYDLLRTMTAGQNARDSWP